MRKGMERRAAAATPITSQTTPKTKREKNISHFSFDLIRLLLWPRAKQIKYAIEKQAKQRINGPNRVVRVLEREKMAKCRGVRKEMAVF